MKSITVSILFIITLSGFTQTIPWNKLKNPIYQHEGWSVKDATFAYNEADQHFYLFFSAFYFDEGKERSHVVGVKTKDFITYSEPIINWSGMEEGWTGMCSPNITLDKDRLYITYNSWGDKPGKPNQLFYAVSDNLIHWKKHLPLASPITKEVRAIDAAIYPYEDSIMLIWKKKQTPQISMAKGYNSQKWNNHGSLNIGWIENGQFIEIDGKLHLVGTVKKHLQKIFELKHPDSLTQWIEKTEITVPEESFNTDERVNAGFLFDNTKVDGYYYYIYAGRTESMSHAGRGDNKLGLARSKDLIEWSIPPN